MEGRVNDEETGSKTSGGKVACAVIMIDYRYVFEATSLIYSCVILACVSIHMVSFSLGRCNSVCISGYD